jgi:hypothetical protein
MSSDLNDRLAHYRTRLDDAIASDLAGRPADGDRHQLDGRRVLVATSAVLIVAAGIGALVWTSLDRSRSPSSSEVIDQPATVVGTSVVISEPEPTLTQSEIPSETAEGVPEPADSTIPDTIFGPPIVVEDPQTISRAEADAINNDAGGRRTVAIERAADGTVLWWMTVWTGTTPSGVEVFCHATQASGHSCVPDHNVVLSNPVQIDGFSMHPPSALMFLANSDVTSLHAVIDDDEPVEIKLAEIGVSSGKQTAGLYLGDRAITTIRFDATLTDGSTYSFSIAAPEVTPSPTAASAVPAPPEPYAPLELFEE